MSEVNNDIYDTLGERWYEAWDDPVALLRVESATKIPWVVEKIRSHSPAGDQSTVLDVGCGGGFLSNALARENFAVTGVDLSTESLAVAGRYDRTGKVRYLPGDAYQLPFPDASFDVVTAMDFLEHVDDPARAIKEFSRVLRPGGVFIFHTFNRNPLAWLVIIKLVEWLVKNTPKNMHVLKLFIKPSELTSYGQAVGLEVKEMVGLRPMFSTLTLRSILTGVVPQGMKFTLTGSLLLSYMGYAKKSPN